MARGALRTEGELMGSFVGRLGSTRYVSDLAFAASRVTFSVPAAVRARCRRAAFRRSAARRAYRRYGAHRSGRDDAFRRCARTVTRTLGLARVGPCRVQIQDDAGKALDPLRMGGICGFLAPSVDAALPAGEWQTLDVELVGRR